MRKKRVGKELRKKTHRGAQKGASDGFAREADNTLAVDRNHLVADLNGVAGLLGARREHVDVRAVRWTVSEGT